MPAPEITICPELGAFDCTNWEEISSAFSYAPVWHFDQAWKQYRDKEFRPAAVSVGWRDNAFLFFAELCDEAIVTRATSRNQMLFQMGDTFEIFAGVRGKPAYIEYHIAPNGLLMQAVLPNGSAHSASDGLQDFLVLDDMAFFSVRKELENCRWKVFGRLGTPSIPCSHSSIRGQTWQVSFSRCDYCASGEYVLSSTSLHAEPSFHRRHEWRLITFA